MESLSVTSHPATPTPLPSAPAPTLAAITRFNEYLRERGVSYADRQHIITDISSRHEDDADFCAALVNAMAEREAMR